MGGRFVLPAAAAEPGMRDVDPSDAPGTPRDGHAASQLPPSPTVSPPHQRLCPTFQSCLPMAPFSPHPFPSLFPTFSGFLCYP